MYEAHAQPAAARGAHGRDDRNHRRSGRHSGRFIAMTTNVLTGILVAFATAVALSLRTRPSREFRRFLLRGRFSRRLPPLLGWTAILADILNLKR